MIDLKQYKGAFVWCDEIIAELEKSRAAYDELVDATITNQIEKFIPSIQKANAEVVLQIKENEKLRANLNLATVALDDIVVAVARHHKEFVEPDGSNSVHTYISRRYGEVKSQIQWDNKDEQK